MAYIGLIIQLLGIVTLMLAVIRNDLVLLASGFSILVLHLATAINDIYRKIDKLEIQLSYESRLSTLEKDLRNKGEIMKKGQMNPQTMMIVVIILLILVWLWKNGFLPKP